MRIHNAMGILLAGLCAGAVSGLFGAGGGMVLIPLLTLLSDLEERQVFPSSIAIIFPICIVSLLITSLMGTVPWQTALPYLIGSALGGTFAGFWGHKIPVSWLHKGLGIFILWGGYRYLC